MDSNNNTTIKPISLSSVHQLTSGQVITTLSSALKELVENSLDAGSTSIEVKFKNSGLEYFEVIDNGHGISRSNIDSVGLKHHTSKLEEFEDLTKVKTLGFRGEAVASLCALANVEIISCTDSDAPMATKVELNIDGTVKNKSVAHRKKGTSVKVTQLFEKLPVRRKDLEKNVRREFVKAVGMIQAYALICTGVRIMVSNTAQSGYVKKFHTHFL